MTGLTLEKDGDLWLRTMHYGRIHWFVRDDFGYWVPHSDEEGGMEMWFKGMRKQKLERILKDG